MNLLVIGGDQRNVHLAAALTRAGLNVREAALGTTAAIALADLGNFEAIVGPIPFTADNVHLHTPLDRGRIRIDDFLAALAPTATLFSGTLPAPFVVPCRHIDLTRNVALYDRNLAATAEGVLQTLLNQIDFTLAGSRILIAGHGKVGKAVARRLAALDAGIHVFTKDAAERDEVAQRYPVADLNDLSPYRIVINTIPAPIFTAETLCTLPGNALLLDVATFPGGVDPAISLPPRLRLCRAPGLPGKKAPESVAEAMSEVILAHLNAIG